MSEGLLDAEPSRVKGKRLTQRREPTATHEESLLFNNQMLATEIQFALATESGNEGREFRANREKEKSADERNRTSTSFRTQEPESCASANSATPAAVPYL